LSESHRLSLAALPAGSFTGDARTSGLLGACYALAQFLFFTAPDRRLSRSASALNPVITACVTGSVAGPGLFAFSTVSLDWPDRQPWPLPLLFTAPA